MNIKEIKKENGTVVYRARVYLGTDSITGKKVNTSVTARTKTECKQKAKAKKEEFMQNGSTTYKPVVIETVNELLDLWFETYEKEVKSQTYLGMVSLAKSHIRPQLGTIKLDKLNTPTLQKWVNELTECSRKAYQPIISVLNRALKYGCSLQVIKDNPLTNIVRPKARKDEAHDRKVKCLSPNEVSDLISYLDSLSPTLRNTYDKVLCRLLLATGLRIGEAIALNWSDIDFENKTVTVNKSYSFLINEVTSPKTLKSNRTVAIDNATCLMLKQFRNTKTVAFREIGRETDVIFATELRDYPFLQVLSSRINTHFKHAGLDCRGFHIFRHTHASLLLNEGVSPKELQHRLGHSKISMTLDIYSHLFEDTEKEVANIFEKSLLKLQG